MQIASRIFKESMPCVKRCGVMTKARLVLRLTGWG